jgi:MoaA/NifB/PqqE/SkfB family radical SAM enzyme
MELLAGVLPDAASLGYRVASVSGGEPLLYAPLEQLLAACHTAGLATTVTTNGMLADARRMERLAAHCDLLAISLDGVPESHERMRGSRRAFDSMRDNLPGIRASGIPFGFIFTLTYHNVHELDWVARFAAEEGAALLQIHPLESVGRAVQELPESLPDGRENAVALLEAARIRELYADRMQVHLDLATLPALRRSPERVFACTRSLCADSTFAEALAPIVIETSGQVAPMEYGFARPWCMGSIHDAPLGELLPRWFSTHYEAFRALCRSVHSSLVTAPDAVVNWYQALADAAKRQTPSQALASDGMAPPQAAWDRSLPVVQPP